MHLLHYRKLSYNFNQKGFPLSDDNPENSKNICLAGKTFIYSIERFLFFHGKQINLDQLVCDRFDRKETKLQLQINFSFVKIFIATRL